MKHRQVINVQHDFRGGGEQRGQRKAEKILGVRDLSQSLARAISTDYNS